MNQQIWTMLTRINIQTDDAILSFSDIQYGRIQYRDINIRWGSDGIFLSAKSTAIRTLEFVFDYDLSGGGLVLGDAWERSYGELQLRQVNDVYGEVLPWYCLIDRGDYRIGLGVKTCPGAFCGWKLYSDSVTLLMNVCCGADGVILDGREMKTAYPLLYQTDSDIFYAGKEFCVMMADHPIFPKHPVWGYNTWLHRYDQISEEIVMQDAAELKKLTTSVEDFPYFVIDDGWTPKHTRGPWDQIKSSFSSMHKLADNITAMRLRPGIWIRPLYYEDIGFPVDWILKSGTEQDVLLDITIPDAREYVLENFRRIRTWGYQLIKIDFTFYDMIGYWGYQLDIQHGCGQYHFHNRSKTSAEIFCELYNDIRENIGDEICLIGCNTPSHLSVGFFEIFRSGDDTNAHVWETTKKMGVNTIAYRLMQHGAFYSIDGDCGGFTEYSEETWKQQSEWIRYLADSGTPLFVSGPLDSLFDEQKNFLQKCFQTNLQNCKMKPCIEPFKPILMRYLVNDIPVEYQFI